MTKGFFWKAENFSEAGLLEQETGYLKKMEIPERKTGSYRNEKRSGFIEPAFAYEESIPQVGSFALTIAEKRRT